MKLSLVHKQKETVDALRAEVAVLSAQAVHNRRKLTTRKKAILGRPLVMLGAFASGVFLVPRSAANASEQKADAPLKATTVSTLSLINSALATWTLLRRVDNLNKSNAQAEEPTRLA